MTDQWHAEITLFEKQGGPLSKRLWLDPSGKLNNDAGGCLMVQGIAQRIEITDVHSYAGIVNDCRSNQALALGRLKDGLPQQVSVVTNNKLNGGSDPNTIARTKEFLIFEPGAGGLVLIDFDPKGMSAKVKQRFDECGGLIAALVTVMPALETAAMVERASTSAGLRHSETGQTFAHSGGKHLVIPVLDAAHIPRFLADLHDRCWLNGFGWGIVSGAGSFLERSIVDKSCGSPERLIFEGAPVIEPPLEQDERQAVVHEGYILDTRLCEPLSDAERAALKQLVTAEELRLLPERQTARAAWSTEHIRRLVERGMSEPEARQQVDHWIDHKELSGGFPLPFDDDKLAGSTVEQVLAEPDKIINRTLADPHEGRDYGRAKAIIYRRDDGSLFIHSFAHGGMSYDLIEGDKPKVSLPWINMANWDNEPIPQQEWAVLNKIPLHQCVLFSGEGAAGKSTVELHRSAAHVLGRDWLGTLPETGPAIHVDAEDGEDVIRRRLAAITRHYGVTFADLISSGLHLMSLAAKDAVLATVNRNGKVEPTTLYKQLLEAAGDIKPKSISIASCANVFTGDENARSQVQQFVGLLTRMAILANGSVVLVSQPSLTGINTDTGLSGSTQWHNAVRARFYMKGIKPESGEQPDDDLREIVFKKNQYGPKAESIALRYRDGMFLPLPNPSTLDKAAAEQRADDVFLRLLTRFANENRKVSHSLTSNNSAPKVFCAEQEARQGGVSKEALGDAMRRLLAAGKIKNVNYGPPSKGWEKLVIATSGETNS